MWHEQIYIHWYIVNKTPLSLFVFKAINNNDKAGYFTYIYLLFLFFYLILSLNLNNSGLG